MEPAKLPVLEIGDQLTRPEFERRYEAMADLKKAELIEGEVYMPSPVRWKQHASPHAVSSAGWFFSRRTRQVLTSATTAVSDWTWTMSRSPMPP
jgi:hypothetical protein